MVGIRFPGKGFLTTLFADPPHEAALWVDAGSKISPLKTGRPHASVPTCWPVRYSLKLPPRVLLSATVDSPLPAPALVYLNWSKLKKKKLLFFPL